MKIMTFRAVAPNLDKVPHSNDFFDTVKFRYHEYAKEGLFKPTEAEAMYIYQIKDAKGQKRTGIVVATDIADFLSGAMIPHETTIVNNEDLQTELLQTRGAAIKPILLIHPPLKELSSLIAQYMDSHKKFYVVELGSEKHRFWQITEGLIQKKLKQIFADKIPSVHIADGHHRSASFAALHKQAPTDKTDKMLCAYFPENNLTIHSFSRRVKDLNGLSADEFLGKLMEIFKVKVLKEGALPNAKFEMTMQLDGKWFRLNWKKAILKSFENKETLFDVHLLNEKVLKPILGITDTRTDQRLKFINSDLHDIANTEGVTFCLFPIELEDVKTVANSGGVLPPKSTFFEPRMKNGLLVYEI